MPITSSSLTYICHHKVNLNHFNPCFWLFGCLFLFIISGCNKKTQTEKQEGGIELVIVDISESRTGKLSEFFEPEIDYIWLEDELDEAQLNVGLHQIRFYGDKIYNLDIYNCKCISIFNKAGKYIGKIDAYGEGPGEYLDFDALTFVNEELVLLGVYPRKIMWFSLEGEFLREFFIQTLNENLQDTINFLPYYSERLESEMSGRNYFQKSKQHLYFGMTFLDTIYQFHNQQMIPMFTFDYGNYGQNLEELKRLELRDRLKIINSRVKLYFRGQYRVSEKQFYTFFSYEKKVYNLFYDREKSQSHVIEGNLINDIDEGHDPKSIGYGFEPGKVGTRIAGKDLYHALVEKKKQMGKEDFENWANSKGKNFAKTALAAKDSENPVLIVYSLK